jgi:hypothetical protein
MNQSETDLGIVNESQLPRFGISAVTERVPQAAEPQRASVEPREPSVPADTAELRPWMIDQKGQLGVMTRLRPIITYGQTPVYASIAGTAPGSHLPKWGQIDDPGVVPHYPTKVFDELRFLGSMNLH